VRRPRPENSRDRGQLSRCCLKAEGLDGERADQVSSERTQRPKARQHHTTHLPCGGGHTLSPRRGSKPELHQDCGCMACNKVKRVRSRNSGNDPHFFNQIEARAAHECHGPSTPDELLHIGKCFQRSGERSGWQSCYRSVPTRAMIPPVTGTPCALIDR